MGTSGDKNPKRREARQGSNSEAATDAALTAAEAASPGLITGIGAVIGRTVSGIANALT
ncbi:hypothetical protein JK358_31835 [Nocardia sp. 2]|uniref:Uncharacterized protein n=1 Tax=Nocardia acididurans TaxID=2802282 RepID=A0ABS1MG36_9NOCA|nr:hypothetical protein [Nocardia acididurans]MBL1079005.1 hypothetical protein [Nocardia acididurans]